MFPWKSVHFALAFKSQTAYINNIMVIVRADIFNKGFHTETITQTFCSAATVSQ